MNYSFTCIGFAALTLSTMIQAEVKSLSSGELTETYIKDSTIIVTPAKPKPKKKRVVTYTISAGKPIKTEAEEQAELGNAINDGLVQLKEANDEARRLLEEAVTNPSVQPELAALFEREVNVKEAPNLQIPDGAFTFEQILQQNNLPLPVGDELNIQSDGQQLTLTIGNIPSVDSINIPDRIQGGAIELIPRDSGGFDIVIDIPQN